MEIVVKIILPILSFVVCMGIPFVYVLRTNKFIQGGLLAWGLLVAWYIALVIPVSLLVQYFDEELVRFLPEGPSIVAAICTGWVNGIVIAGLARICRALAKRFSDGKYFNDVELENLDEPSVGDSQ